MVIVLAAILGATAVTALGGFVTMHLLALSAEHLGILAPIGYWTSTLLYVLLTLFLALAFPSRMAGKQS